MVIELLLFFFMLGLYFMSCDDDSKFKLGAIVYSISTISLIIIGIVRLW